MFASNVPQYSLNPASQLKMALLEAVAIPRPSKAGDAGFKFVGVTVSKTMFGGRAILRKGAVK